MKPSDYDKDADVYVKNQRRYYSTAMDEPRKALYSQVNLPVKGKRLLDAGCGVWDDMEHFRKMGADVYGFKHFFQDLIF